MGNPLPLPIGNVVEVNVSVAAGAVAPLTFNQGLIVGPSTIIPSYGANSRIRVYGPGGTAALAAMLTDGFITSDPEYIAAEIYFEQDPSPNFIYIGRQDLTAIATAIPHSGSAGTGYVVGDIIGVTQGGGSNGFLRVTTIGGSGAVTGLAVNTPGTQGTGYMDGTGLATTGGSGTGLEVDITAIGESYLQAVQACALVNNNWYPFMACNAVDADHEALGAWSTANWQTALYMGSTADAAVPTSATNDVVSVMKGVKDRALMMYDTTQTGDEFPNNVYAAAAAMGLACGLNTGAPGSAFTLALKSVAGIAYEPLTETQFQALLGTAGNNGKNCNSVVAFGPFVGYLYNGILTSGEWYDQIMYRAMLVNMIQINVMNVLVSAPKNPQTNAGEQLLIQAVEAACVTMSNIGYLGAGVWDGASVNVGPVQLVANGQSLPSGFIVGAPSYATQSSGNRDARQAMPITVCIIEAGAVNSVVINVNVQQ